MLSIFHLGKASITKHTDFVFVLFGLLFIKLNRYEISLYALFPKASPIHPTSEFFMQWQKWYM